MGYNETTKILTFKTVGGTKIAVNGNGDLQKALSRSGIMSHLQLVCDVDGNNQRVNKTNIWAKYKPFRNATIFSDYYSDSGSARFAALQAANYGLDVISADPNQPLDYSSIAGAFKQIWTYFPPRAGQDPARVLDFDGYHAEKVLPVRSRGDVHFYKALMSPPFLFDAAINANTADVCLTDLTANALDGWYIGVAFAKNAGFTGTIMYKTASTAIPSSGVPDANQVFPSLTDQDISRDLSGYTHYFMFATDKAKTSFNGYADSALFRCLPRESTSEMTGRFIITEQFVGSATIVSACFTNDPSSRNVFEDMALYTGNQSTAYKNISTYFLNLGISIAAPQGIDTVLTTNPGGGVFGIQVALSQTFRTNGAPLSARTPTRMRDENYVERTTITIPAGTTQTVYLNFGEVLAMNTSGESAAGVPEGQTMNIAFTLFQRGAEDPAYLNLRLSNL